MSVPNVDVNYLAVLVAAIINMVIGSIWYSPSMGFGKSWMKYSGIKMGKMSASKQKGMAGTYILALVGALVMSFVLANFVVYLTAATFSQGVLVGLIVWIGFILTTMLGTLLWEGKSFKLYLINTLYYLVVLAINGGILAVWH